MPGDRPAPTRLQYIDGLRGVAVLIMIEAHVLDAWTRFPDRSTIAYRNLTIVGGFAAPLFLLLAGVALVLSAETAARRQGSRRTAGAAIVARGAQIFILAFLFRLQAFIVTPGSPLVTLFRVDILNVMGPGIALAGVIWMLCPTPWAAALGSSLGATGVAMATPIIRTADWVGTLPIWLQWYMRPAGEHTTFTLFPWVGFVFAGAAVGALIGASRARGSDRAMHAGIATTGAVLVIVGFYAASRPSIYPNASFWTTSPAYFAIRVGVICLSLWMASALMRLARWAPGPFSVLERFGRHSLFVYWIHVELVYGYATWPIHHRLPIWGLAVAYVVFCTMMYAAIAAWDHLAVAWRARRQSTVRQPRSLGLQ